MTFTTDTTTGRRCQAEETLAEIRRMYDDETSRLIRAHLLKAGESVETVVFLLKEREQGEDR